MTNTAVITVYNMDVFEAKLAQVSKKAAKAGVCAPTFEVLEEVLVKKSKQTWEGLKTYEVFSHFEVEVCFEEIALPGGWQLVGVLDHTENLVRSVPDQTMDLRPFVDRGPVCDHCGAYRNRSETFVLVNESGEVKQVGRQCLGLFLGIDPERALAQVGMLSETMVVDEEWTGRPQAKGFDLDFFLAHVACMVRTAGWRSRSMGGEGVLPTADMALNNMSDQWAKRKDHYGNPLWVDPSADDGALAGQVVVWLQGLATRQNLSDYMSNLAQIGQNGFCTAKSAGYAASAINSYLKEREEFVKQAAKKASGAGGQHVGKVGDRITLVVNKVSSAGFDSMYGYQFFHKMVDEFGNTLVWKTGNELDNGKYKVTGTVKSHDEFRGELQTNLTRCKVVEM